MGINVLGNERVADGSLQESPGHAELGRKLINSPIAPNPDVGFLRPGVHRGGWCCLDRLFLVEMDIVIHSTPNENRRRLGSAAGLSLVIKTTQVVVPLRFLLRSGAREAVRRWRPA